MNHRIYGWDNIQTVYKLYHNGSDVQYSQDNGRTWITVPTDTDVWKFDWIFKVN